MPGLASSPPAAALPCDLLAPGSCVCLGIPGGSGGIPTRQGTDPPALAHASSWEFALEARASGPGRQVWLADTHWPHPVISRQGYFRPDLDSGPASIWPVVSAHHCQDRLPVRPAVGQGLNEQSHTGRPLT